MTQRSRGIVACFTLTLSCLAVQPAAAAVRIFKLDAVELIKTGKEVAGDKKYEVVRDGFTYYFVSEANKKAFEAEPMKYELQMGGACGRMGPLSGSGNPKLHAVHDGRLYLFASPQCRTSFLKSPEKLIEKDDPPVKGDAAAMKRGRELLELAVKAHGGAETIDAVKTVRQVRTTVVTQGGAEYDYRYTTTIAFPDRIHDEFCWNDNCSWQSVDGARGADWTGSGFDRPLAASQVRSVKRKVNANLLSILKSRAHPGFVVASAGEAKAGDTKVEWIGISLDGMTWFLGVDPRSGKVRTLEYTGRGGERDQMGAVLLTFVDYEISNGVTLPVSWITTFDGKPDKEPTKLSKIEINSNVDSKLFAVDAP